MSIFLTILQGLSVIALAIVGFPQKGCFYRWRWCIVIFSALIFLLTLVMKENEIKKSEQISYKQIEEIRERLFNSLASKVMEAPREMTSLPFPKRTGKIKILSPADNDSVNAKTYVEGFVSDPKVKVWVVIHPMEVSSYWVQPLISVDKSGNWQVSGYFGRSSNIDSDKKFELIAFANPKMELKEGDVLSEWPEAQWNSDVIVVTRK